MSVLQAGFGSYQSAAVNKTSRSLRFCASRGQYLQRTPGSSGDRQKWTLNLSMKRGDLVGAQYFLFSAADGSGGGNYDAIDIVSGAVRLYFNGSTSANVIPTKLLRDSTSHVNIHIAVDTTQATASNRVKIEFDGVAISSFSAASYPSLNYQTNVNLSGRKHLFGAAAFTTPIAFLDAAALSRIQFVDGSQLPASDFGEFDATTGQWVWKPFAGSYGAQGYHLDFADATSTTTLGYDVSGNGNHFTLNNFSLTPGVNYDSLFDVPPGNGWNDGGNKRGNYCVLNPLVPSAANISFGNLRSGTTPVRGTMDALAMNGRWEVTAAGSNVTAGVINEAGTTHTTTVTANKTFGFRLSAAGSLDYRNVTDGGSWTSITTGLSGLWFPYGTGAAADWNFGQRAFADSSVPGYAAMNTSNIASDSVTLSGSFTGNLSTDGPVVYMNGTPETLTINGFSVTIGTHYDRLANGFKVRTNNPSYNNNTTNSWSATVLSPASKSAFRVQNAKGNP